MESWRCSWFDHGRPMSTPATPTDSSTALVHPEPPPPTPGDRGTLDRGDPRSVHVVISLGLIGATDVGALRYVSPFTFGWWAKADGPDWQENGGKKFRACVCAYVEVLRAFVARLENTFPSRGPLDRQFTRARSVLDEKLTRAPGLLGGGGQYPPNAHRHAVMWARTLLDVLRDSVGNSDLSSLAEKLFTLPPDGWERISLDLSAARIQVVPPEAVAAMEQELAEVLAAEDGAGPAGLSCPPLPTNFGEGLKGLWRMARRNVTRAKKVTPGPLRPASEVAQTLNMTLTEVSKAHKAGMIFGRKPLPEEGYGKTRLLLSVSDALQWAWGKLPRAR
jgi:hypothetical protein